jgi:hypothetical protein
LVTSNAAGYPEHGIRDCQLHILNKVLASKERLFQAYSKLIAIKSGLLSFLKLQNLTLLNSQTSGAC